MQSIICLLLEFKKFKFSLDSVVCYFVKSYLAPSANFAVFHVCRCPRCTHSTCPHVMFPSTSVAQGAWSHIYSYGRVGLRASKRTLTFFEKPPLKSCRHCTVRSTTRTCLGRVRYGTTQLQTLHCTCMPSVPSTQAPCSTTVNLLILRTAHAIEINISTPCSFRPCHSPGPLHLSLSHHLSRSLPTMACPSLPLTLLLLSLGAACISATAPLPPLSGLRFPPDAYFERTRASMCVSSPAEVRAVFENHFVQLNRCSISGLKAERVPKTQLFLGGMVIRGEKAVDDFFTGLCRPRSKGGLRGLKFVEKKAFIVGNTISVQWVVNAPFLKEPYPGSDAYVTCGGRMLTIVSSFDSAELKFKDWRRRPWGTRVGVACVSGRMFARGGVRVLKRAAWWMFVMPVGPIGNCWLPAQQSHRARICFMVLWRNTLPCDNHMMLHQIMHASGWVYI